MTPLVVFTIGHSTRAIERLHSPSEGAPRPTSDRRAHDPAVATQSAVQSRPTVLRRSTALGFITGTCLDWAACGVPGATPSTWRGEMPASAVMPITCRHRRSAKSLDRCITLAKRERVVLMCAEAVPWRCHRSLIADALLARGIEVERNHQRRSHAASLADAVGAGNRNSGDISCRPRSASDNNSTMAIGRKTRAHCTSCNVLCICDQDNHSLNEMCSTGSDSC